MNVYWLSLHEEIKQRGYWDQAFIEDLLANRVWNTGYEFEHHISDGSDLESGIIVLPARHHAGDEDRIRQLLKELDWCILILAGDEANEFDPRLVLQHPFNLRIWIMTPDPTQHPTHEYATLYRYLASGYTPQTRGLLPQAHPPKPFDWSFAGQITHKRREEMAKQLHQMEGGKLVETEGFTEGLEHEEYFRLLSGSHVAPCPAGPVSPDSMRVFEALEAGCVPIVDSKSAHRGEGYWELTFHQRPPFPVIDEWEQLPEVMTETLANWPYLANRTGAYWQWYKKQTAMQLRDDIQTLSGVKPKQESITVLVPTSWIPSHPETRIIEETIDSVREELPDAPILVMVDGLRKEQEAHRGKYDAFIRRLLWLTNHHWHNVLPILFGRHLHQANMTRQTLRYVETPTILFIEHDTPIHGEVPWNQLVEIIESKKANIIRLLHESFILPPHRHLMLDRKPRVINDVPMIRTVQFSARPHLASTDYYRRILNDYFGKQSRTFVEDVMYGIVMSAWMDEGVPGWQKHRLWIYYPLGDLKRSWHTDGRESEAKGQQIFAYDNAVPDGAPQPGIRID